MSCQQKTELAPGDVREEGWRTKVETGWSLEEDRDFEYQHNICDVVQQTLTITVLWRQAVAAH